MSFEPKHGDLYTYDYMYSGNMPYRKGLWLFLNIDGTLKYLCMVSGSGEIRTVTTLPSYVSSSKRWVYVGNIAYMWSETNV